LDASLKISTAHFIEMIVLHERIFCSYNPEMFHLLLVNASLADISDIVSPLPMESLFTELGNIESPDIENIKAGYKRINEAPGMVLSADTFDLFRQNYPDWGYARLGKLGAATSRHFMHYESLAAFTTGIAYCLTQQEGNKIAASSN